MVAKEAVTTRKRRGTFVEPPEPAKRRTRSRKRAADPEQVPEDVPEQVPEDVPEQVPEDVPEQVPEDVPEDVSGQDSDEPPTTLAAAVEASMKLVEKYNLSPSAIKVCRNLSID
jgi:hypothetical protein